MKIIKIVDSLFAAQKNKDEVEVQKVRSQIESLTKNDSLNSDMTRLSSTYSLPHALCTDYKLWMVFVSHYLKVITDCPLEFNLPVRHVRKVTVKKTHTVPPHHESVLYPGDIDFSVEWTATTFEGKEENIQKLWFLKTP